MLLGRINTSVGLADVADDTNTFCEADAESNANAENPAIVFDNVLVTPATAPGPITTSAIHSVNQKWTVSLLKILNDMNAPDYAFSNIIQWGYDTQAEGYAFKPPGGINRNRNIALIYNSLHNADKLRPSVRHCSMSSNGPKQCDYI